MSAAIAGQFARRTDVRHALEREACHLLSGLELHAVDPLIDDASRLSSRRGLMLISSDSELLRAAKDEGIGTVRAMLAAVCAVQVVRPLPGDNLPHVGRTS